MDDLMPVDGNGAAGPLADCFAVEMTRAMIVCDSCGREAALATLRLYGGAGLVLRCPGRDTVILRMLNTGATLSLLAAHRPGAAGRVLSAESRVTVVQDSGLRTQDFRSASIRGSDGHE